MIKPTKWFLQNYKHFLKVNLLIILEILYDISKENSDYHKNFEEELNALYPSNYYLIDFIISKLLSKSKALFISSSNLLFTATKDDVEFLKNLNYRTEILHNRDFDVETVFGKYKSSFKRKYEKQFKFLVNNSIKQCVKNIYPADYLLELINNELYNQFCGYDDQRGLYDFLQIHYKTIVAQTNSYSQRPSDIEKPSSITTNWQQREVVYWDWIRLAYYEYEMYEESYSNNKEYRVFEGIVFKNDINETIPFSRYRLFPIHIWENKSMNGLDEFLCLFLSQRYDMLEDYNILWLNPIIINKLNMEVENHINGLAAINNKSEIVLKYNRWSSD